MPVRKKPKSMRAPKQPYSGTPNFETLTRIARATRTGGKKKALTKKDYRRASKNVKKLKRSNVKNFLKKFM